jgi:hypothetical protein
LKTKGKEIILCLNLCQRQSLHNGGQCLQVFEAQGIDRCCRLPVNPTTDSTRCVAIWADEVWQVLVAIIDRYEMDQCLVFAVLIHLGT